MPDLVDKVPDEYVARARSELFEHSMVKDMLKQVLERLKETKLKADLSEPTLQDLIHGQVRY